ncbi:MAG: 3-isopropylmalate dehydratase large subunit [Pseudomonadota bacterium]
MAQTLFDKLWASHVVAEREADALLYVDRHFVHEGSFHAFDKVEARGAGVARPDLTFGIADHYVPTRREAGISDPTIRRMVDDLTDNCEKHGIGLFGLDDPRQGIVHVVGPEQGLALPGLLIVCGDSHTATQGAFGAYAFGIGATEVSHVLMTQSLWQAKPKRMRVTVEGQLGEAVSAKDVILTIIATIGADGAAGHAVEYAGSAITALSMEGRMTVCNMTIEAGGRCGMVAPDKVTLAYVKDRPFAPKGDAFERAAEEWLSLRSDADAVFDKEVRLHASEIAPAVTWGTSPEDAVPVTGHVPSPEDSEDRAPHVRQALDYMDLSPGTALDGLGIDKVFIGSCTNARLDDLRMAAKVLRGRQAKVPGLVSPGSTQVKAAAEAEGLHTVFTDAGLEWVASGCSMCVGMNGDRGAPGERVASTTNRNFRGRQGRGVRTHLMSPAMVAAAAVAGTITDVRPLLEGR